MSPDDDRRHVGVFGATLVGVGGIVGGGVLILAGTAFGLAGPAAILAFALNGGIAWLTAMSVAEISVSFPESGGAYTFAKKVLSVRAAFSVGWVLWFAYIVAAVLYAMASAAFLVILLQGGCSALGLDTSWLAGRNVLLLFATLAIVGYSVALVRSAGGGGQWATIGKVVLFMLLIGVGVIALFRQPLDDLGPELTPFFSGGLDGLIAAMGVTFISLQGFEMVAGIAGEIKDPKRAIPKAIFRSLGISLLVYLPLLFLIPTAGLDGGAHINDVARANPDTVMAIAARGFLGEPGYWFVIVAIVLSTLSALQSNLLTASRVSFAMAGDHTLPSVLEQRHPTRGTPIMAIYATALATVAIMFMIPDLTSAGAAASLIFLLAFGLTHVTGYLARKRAGSVEDRPAWSPGDEARAGLAATERARVADEAAAATPDGVTAADGSPDGAAAAAADQASDDAGASFAAADAISDEAADDALDAVPPYRTPWFPLVPVVGGLSCGGLVVFQAVVVPDAGGILLIWLGLGVILYFALFKGRAEAADATAEALDPRLNRLRGKSPLVLLPIANPKHATTMVEVANALAPSEFARVLLLSIIRSTRGGIAGDPVKQLADAQDAFRQALSASYAAGHAPEALITSASEPWPEIRRIAEEHACGSLLIGLPKKIDRAFDRELETLLNGVDCDVAMMRAPDAWRIGGARRVLVPIAGRTAEHELRARVLATLSRELPRELVFLNVLPAAASEDDVSSAVKSLTRLSDMNIPGTPTIEAVRSDDAAAAILSAAGRCDLVVLGMRTARTGRKMLGAINRKVAAEAACAVMVLSRRQQVGVSDFARPIRDVAQLVPQIVPFLPSRKPDQTEH